ncbi:hypothetical protein VI817_007593 [Penicillium citrinum]|nr:hypothetical protein VI817_007593 [Penicillium citrinum]
MFRNAARFSQRATRSTPVRQAAQRRFNSAKAEPEWIADNEFNRERAAVKHHAASTSGMCTAIVLQDNVLQSTIDSYNLC